MKQKKRILWLMLVVTLLILTACTGQSTDETQTDDIVTAFIGDLTASAAATGEVSAQRSAALTISQPGRVSELYVQIGDVVQAGDPLVQLETAELTLSLLAAEQSLRLQEANLAALQEPAQATDVAAATANVASAQANLDTLLAGPTPEQLAVYSATLTISEASLYSASAQYQSAANSVSDAQIQQAEAAILVAQTNLDRAREIDAENPTQQTYDAVQSALETLANAQAQLDNLLNTDTSSAQGSLAAAAARLDGSEANYISNTSGASAAQIASAEAQLAQAQAALDDLLAEPTAAEIQTTAAQVEQARLSVAEAQTALDKATLTAPFAGIVTAVHVNVGEYASGIAVELMDTASLEVIVPVDEVDIGVIELGQKATITLETWPDVAIESEVALIAPGAAANSTLVTYDVHLRLGQTELPVRVGMTANVQLITAQRTDILLLPNRAIQVNRQDGTYTVNRLNGATVEVVEVTIGLRDGQNTQITSGLNEGDEVVVGNDVPTINFGPG
ncbi:MAG: HlyD family efflux transporter periplasmic adaptor subunit [Chloroflexi bacterium]|nr:HlyD family efflux transporter periplasmic adaptor subunit [Chloroflexota bacterium]